MCVKVIPTLKKEKKKRTNQSTPVIEVGTSDSLMHGYYISVNKLQDEMYLYRWRRGREMGRGGYNWDLVHHSLHSFLTPCLSCALCVFVYKTRQDASASSVCHSVCSPSLLEWYPRCLYLYLPWFHLIGRECDMVCELLCVPSFVFYLSSTVLGGLSASGAWRSINTQMDYGFVRRIKMA